MSDTQHTDAQAFAVVMGFEALRICLGQPTKKHPPEEVIRWMKTIRDVRRARIATETADSTGRRS